MELKTYSTAATQTDCTGCCPTCCPTCSSTNVEKSVSQTVSECMTTFISTVSADVNVLHTELRDVITSLLVQQSEVNELRDAMKQALGKQDELKELQNAVTLLTVQVNTLSSSVTASKQQPSWLLPSSSHTHSLSVQNCNDPFTLTNSNQYNDERTNSDYPSLLPLTSSKQPQQPNTTRATPTSHSLSSRKQPQSSREQLKQDVMAAMYVDLNSKHRRAKNIIISGLQHKDISDQASVCNLLADEFRWDADDLTQAIHSCRRIGKAQHDRVQPLLVSFNTTDAAAFFIDHAKQLRESRNAAVKNSIFISADLTPAESKAAFEMRCRRREQQTRNENNSEYQQQQQSASTGRVFYGSRSHQPVATSNSESRLVWRAARNEPGGDDLPMLTDQNSATSTTSIINDLQSVPAAAAVGTAGRPR